MKYRIEKDSLGEVKVPQKALWGHKHKEHWIISQSAVLNLLFHLEDLFIEALGVIKYSAAAAK